MLFRRTSYMLCCKVRTIKAFRYKFPSVNRVYRCVSLMEFCEALSINPTSCAPAWLNKQFIEKSLRLGYNDSELCVTKVDISPATAPGDNYVSELYRIATEILNNGRGRSIIAKCLPTSEYNLKFINDARLFEKEIRFYDVTLPKMNAKHLAPRCLYTQEDLLLLEDLSPLGFKLVNRCDGLDLRHCKAAIKALACLHANSLSIPASELAQHYPETVYHDKDHAYRYINHSLTSLAGIVATWNGYERFAKSIHELSTTALDKLLALMPENNSEDDSISSHFVLNHGDFWTNNIMFKYDGPNITEVKLIDYQMCRYAPLALDLQYFIYTSVNEADQVNCRDILLEEYRGELCNLLKKDNYITRDQLKEEMDKTDLFGFINACMMLPVVLSDPANDVPDLGNVAESSDVPKDSNTLSWHTGLLFRRRFQECLLHFESRGLFK